MPKDHVKKTVTHKDMGQNLVACMFLPQHLERRAEDCRLVLRHVAAVARKKNEKVYEKQPS